MVLQTHISLADGKGEEMTAHELANKLLTMADVEINIKIEVEKITGTGLYDLVNAEACSCGCEIYLTIGGKQ